MVKLSVGACRIGQWFLVEWVGLVKFSALGVRTAQSLCGCIEDWSKFQQEQAELRPNG